MKTKLLLHSDVHFGHMDNISIKKWGKYMATFDAPAAGIFYGGDSWFDQPDELFELRNCVREVLKKQGQLL